MTHPRHVRVIHSGEGRGHLHSDSHQPLSDDCWGVGERGGREVGEEFQRPEEELRQDRVLRWFGRGKGWNVHHTEGPCESSTENKVKRNPAIKSLIRPGEGLGFKSRTMERHYVWGVGGVRRGIMASGKIKRSFY